jgi:hypothetical protein
VIIGDGQRSATLLPDIDGIDPVDQQLSAVRRKAGIARATVVLQRCTVEKIS